MRTFSFFLFIAFFLICSFVTPRISHAQDDDAHFCENHCWPDDVSKNPCIQDSRYASPDCCKDVQSTGDPMACGWPDRGYCLDTQCSTIPEDVNRQRCGGPKHSWCSLCTEHNCFSSPTKTPTKTVPTKKPTATPTRKPTKTPKPTKQPTSAQPTVRPTSPSTQNPTAVPFFNQNTNVAPITDFHLQEQTVLPTTITNTFSLPTFSLPPIPIPDGTDHFVQPIDSAIPKALNPLKLLFLTVIHYDSQLERYINEGITNATQAISFPLPPIKP